MAQTSGMDLPTTAEWRHCFDSVQGGGGEVNRGLGLANAFLDFMEQAGAEADRVTVAVVVHGDAVFDVVTGERRAMELGHSDNPNSTLVERIVGAAGELWVCARSAESLGVGDEHLLTGVRFAPSAMVAFAELQRRGFSLNPY